MTIIPNTPFTRPWIPEIEFSGEVVFAGANAPPDVRDPGTRVIGFQSIFGYAMGRGVLAEYVCVPGSHLARVNDKVDMVAASGINGAGSCALKMARVGGVRAGHCVLVNGASGSVGAVLVQVCKDLGARVVGVASGGNEEMVRGLGVDEVCLQHRETSQNPKQTNWASSSSTTANTTHCRLILLVSMVTSRLTLCWIVSGRRRFMSTRRLISNPKGL